MAKSAILRVMLLIVSSCRTPVRTQFMGFISIADGLEDGAEILVFQALSPAPG